MFTTRLLLLIVASTVNADIYLDILETITIEEGRHIAYSLINLTETLLRKQRFSKLLTTRIIIYPSSDSELYPFIIKDGHLLYLSNAADREAICQSPPTKSLLKLCTSDLCCKPLGFQYTLDGEVETFFILVKILDINDNEPKFKPMKHPYIQVPENVKEGFSINLPMAEDLDSVKYAVQRYSISQTSPLTAMNDFRFLVDHGTPLRPRLIVSTMLDYERTRKYVFKLTAYDWSVGTTGNNGSVTVEIEIEDLNDNTPVFEVTSYKVEVKENEQVDNLLQWKVVDGDSGRNGAVNVNIDSEEMRKRFQVTNTKYKEGVLGLIVPLDYEQGVVMFQFSLVASDNGIPPRSSTAAVVVQLININDNGPKIKFKRLGHTESNTVQLKEGLPAHTLVTEVRVTDADSPRTGISCRLEDSTSLFSLDQQAQHNSLMEYIAYNLKTTSVLDRESDIGGFIRLTVACTDGDTTASITSNESLSIQIEDVNDNAPLFSRHLFVASIEENQLNARVNFTTPVIVTDKDSGLNGKLEFFLEDFQNSSDSEWFLCDKMYMKIATRRALDFELQNLYKFKLIAKDMGMPSLSSSATVLVNVLDMNDNAPVFAESQYSFQVSEDVAIGTRIGSVSATDKDSLPRHKVVLYTIEPRVVGGDFMLVDMHTGVIRTRKRLDREMHESFIFKIIATNTSPLVGLLPREPSSEVHVVVKVTDVNDNAPKFKLKSHLKPTIEFTIELYTEGSTCAELPYSVHDADDEDNASSGSHCPTLSLENDHDKLFSLTSSSLCLMRQPLKYQSLTVTLIAKDCPSEPNKSFTSKVSFTVLIKNDPNAKVSNNKQIDTGYMVSTDSRNVIIVIILVTVVLAFLTIVIIIVAIVRRSTISDNEYGKGGVLSINSGAKDEHDASHYTMSEKSVFQSHHHCDGRTLSRQYQGYANTIGRASTFNVNGSFPPPTYQHIMTNDGIRIVANPRAIIDHYSYEWSPDIASGHNRMHMPSSRSERTLSSDRLTGEEKLQNDATQDSVYQVLNPFSARHQQGTYYPDDDGDGNLGSHHNKDDQSFTTANNIFNDDQVKGDPWKKSHCQTMKKNFFQSTFV